MKNIITRIRRHPGDPGRMTTGRSGRQRGMPERQQRRPRGQERRE